MRRRRALMTGGAVLVSCGVNALVGGWGVVVLVGVCLIGLGTTYGRSW